MLDTLLQIGKILRQSGRLRHHRYIKPAPQNDKKMSVVYFSLPVREDFSFDFDNISTINDEDLIRYKLFSLAYKTSDSDNQVKYIFGDISFGIDKKGGYFVGTTYYQLAEPNKANHKRKSSFERGDSEVDGFKGSIIEKFRNSFSANREQIEEFLQKNGKEQICFLHFDFQGKHWYQFESELEAINNKLLNDFVKKQNDKFVLRKSLYKTIASPEKNLPFPQFTAESMYKTKTFDSADEVMDLLYAITYSTKDTLRERDIKIIVLPKGNNLEADQIEEFFERDKGEKKSNTSKITEQDKAETKISDDRNNTSVDDFLDSLFPKTLFEIGDNIESFDFIFSKAGGVSSPDVDMIELAGLRKSHLRKVGEEIAKVRLEVQAERDELIKSKKELYPFDVRRSFMNILGDITKDKKKYQSHLLKVLPQIYSGNYRRDDLLLTAFIEKTEFNTRNGNGNFNLLKFDYEFLSRLQINGENRMEKLKDSKSYQAGILLGKMAKPLSWQPVPIKSFEPRHIGYISRRVRDTYEITKLAVELAEMLRRHKRLFYSQRMAHLDLSEKIGEIENEPTKFDRYKCAFGFLEGYYAKPEKKEQQEFQEDENQDEKDNL